MNNENPLSKRYKTRELLPDLSRTIELSRHIPFINIAHAIRANFLPETWPARYSERWSHKQPSEHKEGFWYPLKVLRWETRNEEKSELTLSFINHLAGMGSLKLVLHVLLKILEMEELGLRWLWTITDFIIFGEASPPTREHRKTANSMGDIYQLAGYPSAATITDRKHEKRRNNPDNWTRKLSTLWELGGIIDNGIWGERNKNYSEILKESRQLSKKEIKNLIARRKRLGVHSNNKIRRGNTQNKELIRSIFGSEDSYNKFKQRARKEGFYLD